MLAADPQPGDGITQLWGVIGPYDMAAIKYGYGVFGTDPASERRELAAFAETFSWRSCAEDFVKNLQPYPEAEKSRFWRRLRRLARVRRKAPEDA